MFKRITVKSATEMNDEIFKFLSALLDKQNIVNDNIIKVKSRDEKNIIWFMKDLSHGGLAVWVTDEADTKYDGSDISHPNQAVGTLGLVGKYRAKLTRHEIDLEKTLEYQQEEYEKLYEEYELEKATAVTTHEYLEAYLRFIKKKFIIDKHEEYKLVDYKVDAENLFHIGALLKYDEVVPKGMFTSGHTKLYKTLDCHYNNGCFMFSLYTNDCTMTTNSLVVGELDTYDSNITNKAFFMSNSFIISSEYKPIGEKDAFLLKSITRIEEDIERGIPAYEEVIHYDNDVLFAVRANIDDIINEKESLRCSIGGVRVGLSWSLTKLHIKHFSMNNMTKDETEAFSITPSPIEWRYRQLYTTVSYFPTNIVDYYPMTAMKDEPYYVLDPNNDVYLSISCKKINDIGNSVNTKNCISLVLPVIFYIQRDEELEDVFSAIGQTNILNYVNMYNMNSGRIVQPTYDSTGKFACYSLYRRRSLPSFFNEIANLKEKDSKYTSSYGYGGYPGFAFSLCTDEDFTDIRGKYVNELL